MSNGMRRPVDSLVGVIEVGRQEAVPAMLYVTVPIAPKEGVVLTAQRAMEVFVRLSALDPETREAARDQAARATNLTMHPDTARELEQMMVDNGCPVLGIRPD